MAVKVYNVEKKELIGIFLTRTLAGRYLLPLRGPTVASSRIDQALRQKNRMRDTIFPFPVALRVGNDSELNGELYKISEGYPQPTNFKDYVDRSNQTIGKKY